MQGEREQELQHGAVWLPERQGRCVAVVRVGVARMLRAAELEHKLHDKWRLERLHSPVSLGGSVTVLCCCCPFHHTISIRQVARDAQVRRRNGAHQLQQHAKWPIPHAATPPRITQQCRQQGQQQLWHTTAGVLGSRDAKHLSHPVCSPSAGVYKPPEEAGHVRVARELSDKVDCFVPTRQGGAVLVEAAVEGWRAVADFRGRGVPPTACKFSVHQVPIWFQRWGVPPGCLCWEQFWGAELATGTSWRHLAERAAGCLRYGGVGLSVFYQISKSVVFMIRLGSLCTALVEGGHTRSTAAAAAPSAVHLNETL